MRASSGSGRVACLDLGTNSVLLLVAERGAGGAPRAVVERATITRLGQGVDASGELHPEARERTLRCLAAYADEARALGVERIVAVGTSALRDARGGAEFVREAARLLGEGPRVISGDEEARLTFRGALSGLPVEGPVTVCDVGGGSTEIIVGEASAQGTSLQHGVSLDVGSVRLTERYVGADPMGDEAVAAIGAEVARQLARAPVPRAGAALVGVAGTVTTLAAVARGIEAYDGAQVHGLTLSAVEVQQLARRLVAMSVAERRALAGMEPQRADVIAAGAVLVARVVEWAGASELHVSDRGVRWGLALEALGV